MRVQNFDTKRYARLLAKALPRPIETEEERLRASTVIESPEGCVSAKDDGGSGSLLQQGVVDG